jgi:hypothetical protein
MIDMSDLLNKQAMSTTEQQNKAFVLEAFETLFNKREHVAAKASSSSSRRPPTRSL